MSDFKAKLHQIRFRLGFRPRPRPRWRSLQRSPDPLAGFKGSTSKGREGREGRRGSEGPTYKGKEVNGGEGREGEKGEGGSPRLLRFPRV